MGLFRRLVERITWEAVLKDRYPGRLDILQDRNLQGTGAGCPHMLEDVPAGKKTILAKQRALEQTQEEKKRQSLQSCWPLGERAGYAGELHGYHEAKQRGN